MMQTSAHVTLCWLNACKVKDDAGVTLCIRGGTILRQEVGRNLEEYGAHMELIRTKMERKHRD